MKQTLEKILGYLTEEQKSKSLITIPLTENLSAIIKEQYNYKLDTLQKNDNGSLIPTLGKTNEISKTVYLLHIKKDEVTINIERIKNYLQQHI